MVGVVGGGRRRWIVKKEIEIEYSWNIPFFYNGRDLIKKIYIL